ncbi:MAG TPA: WD40 repeat domain-containing protein [Holophagaceae bacterium]|nr:WD40 repeat domain-containing protein [Holophagaceae bacterium]
MTNVHGEIMRQGRILCTMSQPLNRRTFLAALSAMPPLWVGADLRMAGGEHEPYAPTFLHPNDQWVVLRGDKDFSYEIVDLDSGKRVQSLSDSTCSTWYGLPDLRFDPSGRFLVMGYDGTHDAEIRRWDLHAPGAPLALSGDVLDSERVRAEGPLDGSQEEHQQPPLYGLPAPGGILRMATTDLHLKDFKALRRRTVPVPIPLHSDLSTKVVTGRGQTWELEAWDGKSDYRRIRSKASPLNTHLVSIYGMVGPTGETLRALPVGLAFRRALNRVLIWSGYSTIREIDASTGKLIRALSGSMPHPMLLAFGSSRGTLFAARALDGPFRWNRHGRPVKSPGGLRDEITTPPGAPVGPSLKQTSDATSGLETRALARGDQGLALGLNNGELWIGGGKDPQAGPWSNLGRHEDAIRALAFVPARPWLLSGARDGSLNLWALGSSSAPKRLTPHEARVNAASASAVNSAATCGPDGIRLWDLEKGILRMHLNTGGAWVSDVALSPDGRWVAGALLDGTVRVWNVEGGSLAWSAQAEAGWCAAVAFHPTEARLLAGYELGQVVAWNAQSGAREQRIHVRAKTEYQEGPRPVHALTWSADGQALAVAFGDAVRVYDRNLHSPEGPGWLLPLDWADEYT